MSDVCRLLLMRLSLSLSAGFHCRWKDQGWLGTGKIVCKKCYDHLGLGGLRVAGKIINSNGHMLGT